MFTYRLRSCFVLHCGGEGRGDQTGRDGNDSQAEHEHEKRENAAANGDRIDITITNRC